MARTVLGLDLGPNSIGWALLEEDEKTGEFLGFHDTTHAGHPPLGVRVFEAGLANFDSAKEKSLCQDRRIARSMRKNHARRNARRKQLRKLLAGHGMFPDDMNSDPYELRARGLDHELSPEELGRCFYHLSQRRGFQSNRKSGQAKEEQGILAEIGELAKAMEKSGARTLGDYLFMLSQNNGDINKDRLRKRHTRRDMYKHEFQLLVESQRRFHADLLTDDLIEQIRHYLFFQHPYEVTDERREKAPSRANLHRAPSVKPCPLVPSQLCAPKMEWKAQQFRILKEVNNLRISENFGKERELSAEERAAILEFLATRDRVKFDQLRKELAKIGVDPEAKFNLERGDRTTLNGNILDHKLASAYTKKRWAGLTDLQKNDLRDSLLHAEDPEDLKECLIRNGLDEDKCNKLMHWNPGDGYVAYSLEAIDAILPHLQEGKNEHEAIKLAFPDRADNSVFTKLPVLSSRDLPADLQDITNPVVGRCLVEVRKVVNALVREHGVPGRIVVEMGRNLKAGPDERKKRSSRRKRLEELRGKARIAVTELGGNPNRRDDVNRWIFWQEQDKRCMYTGKPIPQSELFHGGEWEVDHILPHWKSLDDSQMNKVLVHRSANADKGDRTPAEWLGEDSQEFRQMVSRAYALLKKPADEATELPYGKLLKLRQTKVETDDFAKRQLNDTRYISRVVVKYLNLLYPPELRVGEKAVQSCRGGLTAELRRQWGLNNILKSLSLADGTLVYSTKTDDDGNPLKSRADHRHHAIDAVVIALSSRKILKRYQDYHKARATAAAAPKFKAPWTSLRSDTLEFASDINVSHRVCRKVSGALHEASYYGQAKDRNGEAVTGVYVTRKKLGELTGKTVPKIRDSAIRDLVTERLLSNGWDGMSTGLPKDWDKEPLVMASGLAVRKVRIDVSIKEPVDLGHRFAMGGNNHHLEVVRVEDRKGRDKLQGIVVTTLEAAKRVHPTDSTSTRGPICTDFGEEAEFVMSLARKESVWATSPETGEKVLCVVQMLSGSSVIGNSIDMVLRDARDSRPASEGNKRPFKRVKSFGQLNSMGFKKIQVDPIGRVLPAND